jgi:hypothetical protein
MVYVFLRRSALTNEGGQIVFRERKDIVMFGGVSPADRASPHLKCAKGVQTPEVQTGRAGRRLHASQRQRSSFDDGVPC